eukprot:5219534-Pleurochrysis_carterae.AAC.3
MKRERSAANTNAFVHAARKETCVIHGKALEEAHWLEAAFPGHALCDWVRLIWIYECDMPNFEYDRCLDCLPEPTEAKWP